MSGVLVVDQLALAIGFHEEVSDLRLLGLEVSVVKHLHLQVSLELGISQSGTDSSTGWNGWSSPSLSPQLSQISSQRIAPTHHRPCPDNRIALLVISFDVILWDVVRLDIRKDGANGCH